MDKNHASVTATIDRAKSCIHIAFSHSSLEMHSVRGFIGGRITSALSNVCDEVGIRPEVIRENLFEAIQELAEEHVHLDDYEAIRLIYDELQNQTHVRSHLAAYFGVKMYGITRILADRGYGYRNGCRPRKLTAEQEQAIIAYARACQCSGHCVTISQLTQWVNEELLNNEDKVSAKFIQNNRVIRANLSTATPKPVEELRIEACYYENFVEFFHKLTQMTSISSLMLTRLRPVQKDKTHDESSLRSCNRC